MLHNIFFLAHEGPKYIPNFGKKNIYNYWYKLNLRNILFDIKQLDFVGATETPKNTTQQNLARKNIFLDTIYGENLAIILEKAGRTKKFNSSSRKKVRNITICPENNLYY